MDDKPSLDDALAHFGVKGMKWGRRKRAVAGGAAAVGVGLLGAAPIVAIGAGAGAYYGIRKVQEHREKGEKMAKALIDAGLMDRPVSDLKKRKD